MSLNNITIAKQLEKLILLKDQFIEKLSSKGITVDSNEKLDELVPKLDNILSTETTATASKILSGYTSYNNNNELITGTALSAASTASASHILSGKTAYNNLGQLITGTMGNYVQAGTIYPVDIKTYTIKYNDSSLGAPKLVISWFSLDSINSFSPYLFQGAASGNHLGTSISGRSGNYRNQNQSMADSTYYIGTSYFQVTVDKYDYLSGGGYECDYIFVW